MKLTKTIPTPDKNQENNHLLRILDRRYEEALLCFTSSKVYEALFDYATGIWRESPDYLLNLYDYCNTQKTA